MSTRYYSPRFYEDQARGKVHASVIRRTRLEEVAPGLRLVPVRVEPWLLAYRHIWKDERGDDTKLVQWQMLCAFRKTYGKRYMHEITALEAQAWTLKRGLATTKVLKYAWKCAVQMQVVPINVWLFVTPPRRTAPKVRPPTEQELQIILLNAETRSASFARMIKVAAYSGARKGGLLRLRRTDVDLKNERMTVTEKGNKTRTIVLAGPALEAMKEQFEMRERHLWQVGDGMHTISSLSPLVFVTSEAKYYRHRHHPWKEQILYREWRMIRGEFPFGFHALKHYAATWLAEQGIDKRDIAIQLGHMDSEGRPYVDLLDRVYVHPDPEDALKRVQAVIANREAA